MMTAKLHIVYCGKQSLGFLFSDNLSAHTWGNYNILLNCFFFPLHISLGAWWGTQWDKHVYHVKSQGTQNYEVHNVPLNLLWGAQIFVQLFQPWVCHAANFGSYKTSQCGEKNKYWSRDLVMISLGVPAPQNNGYAAICCVIWFSRHFLVFIFVLLTW